VIKNPKERKKEMLKIIQGNLDDIIKYQSSLLNENKNVNNNININIIQKRKKNLFIK